MQDDITKITDFLKGLPKPSLHEGRKMEMRGRLLAKISESATEPAAESVIRFVKVAVSDLWLSVYQKSVMKERMFELISATRQKRYIFGGVDALTRRMVSAFLIVFMVMGFFSFMNIDVKVAMADSFTVIESLRGDVMVERGGEVYPAFDEMELEQGDKVVTGEDGWVSIKFLDDSVARLKEGTSVSIRRLFEDSENSSVTNVEVEIDHGDIWARVLNLFEDDSSFVVRAGDISAETRKAAFNVHMDDDGARVEVYSNVVEMQSSSEKKQVRSGEMVVTKPDSSSEVAVKISSDEQRDPWVQSNLESDKAHIAKVEESNAEVMKNSVGALPESTFYGMKSLKGGVVKLLTFDDVSREKLDLEVAERQFVEWSVMLTEGDVGQDDAEEVFDVFVDEVEIFKEMIVDVRASGDNEYADELKDYLEKKINNQKKVLSRALPASPLYTAKEYLFEAELSSAESDVERAVIRTGQAKMKLAEAQDLAEAGDNDYVEAYEEIQKDAEVLAEENGEEVVPEEVVEEVKPSAPVIVPIQRTSDFGVPVTGTGDDEKPLDPLLNLTR